MFDAVLVANRGEIAVRVSRTLRRLGIRSVAVYSDADAGAPHTRVADAAVRVGPPPAADSYLHVGRLLDAATSQGVQAVHPGYGFLSESADFARAVTSAGLVWVGPPPHAIALMGDKIAAKRAVEAAGVPLLDGVHEPGLDDDALTAAAADLGFPLLVKAAAGGGGKGMRVVRDAAELPDALASARREARAAFGDDDLLLERYLENPRHIEIQVLADRHGTTLYLGERECSLQRRHQKVVEECPSPLLTAGGREAMGAAAIAAAASCGYTGAGTVEFIVPGDPPPASGPPPFAFLEMNTRLQVEHPVTELVTGLDLVEQQLRVAAGEPLAFSQDDVVLQGHAIEARVYAEDPARGFLPTGGTVLAYAEPSGPGVRVDSGVAQGTVVGSDYDPLLVKVIAAGEHREDALHRLDAALRDLVLLGVTTNVAFLRALLAHPDVRAGRLHTGLAEAVARRPAGVPPPHALAAVALGRLLYAEPAPGAIVDPWDLPGGWRLGEPAWTHLRLQAGDREPVDVRVRGRAAAAEIRLGDHQPARAAIHPASDSEVAVTLDGVTRRCMLVEAGGIAWVGGELGTWVLREEERLDAARHHDASAAGELRAPMPGTVSLVRVVAGEKVRAGQPLVVVEAMKMEHPISAPMDGVVTAVHVRAGQQVRMDQPVAEVAPEEQAAS